MDNDDLLAAPDSVRNNPEEVAKYEARKKALKHAQDKRAEARKHKQEPSVEDLLADIIRVATDPTTNPWHEYQSISRQRYRLYGWYPESYLDCFGTWTRALEVAGLREETGTRLVRAGRSQANKNEHIARYVERYVTPYAMRRGKTIGDGYMLLSISDTHATFLDPFTWHAFLCAIQDLRPDGVLLNGDILEGSEISRHAKIPGWTLPLQLELDFAKSMVHQIRAVGHEGDLFVGGGNHGIDRLASYLSQVAPALANLKSLRIDRLLGLDEYDVQLLQGGTIMSPEGTEDDRPGAMFFDFYRVHHGTFLGATPAAQELRAAGYSGQSGHVHRAQVFYGTTERDAGMSWMCTPSACTERAARSYIKSTTTGWQKGFGFAFLFPERRVHQYPVTTDGDCCFIEGYAYRRPPDLPDPPVDRLWLPDLPLPKAQTCRGSSKLLKPSRNSAKNSGRSSAKVSEGKSSRRQKNKRSTKTSKRR